MDFVFYELYIWYLFFNGMATIPLAIAIGIVSLWFSFFIQPQASWNWISKPLGLSLILLGIAMFFSIEWNVLRNDVKQSLGKSKKCTYCGQISLTKEEKIYLTNFRRREWASPRLTKSRWDAPK